MPYCPKCDMEFVEGVTVCTDCGGPLAESKEAAEAMALEAKKQQMEAFQKKMEELQKLEQEEENRPKRPQPVHAYVKKDQRYEDMKSSAEAFFLVGGVLAVASVLVIGGIVKLPMAGISRYIFYALLLLMTVGSFFIGFSSRKSAAVLKTEAVDEEKETDEIINWFLHTYDGKSIDQQILSEDPDLSGEELALKRFELLQDYLVTGRDLPDQSYVDALCDLLYPKLFED